MVGVQRGGGGDYGVWTWREYCHLLHYVHGIYIQGVCSIVSNTLEFYRLSVGVGVGVGGII